MKMKLNWLLVVALTLTVFATGCKHRPPGTTKLPDRGPGGTVGEPTPGQPITQPGGPGSGPGSDNPTGIPQGPGHVGWNENRDQFKADTVYFDFDSSVVKGSEQSKVAAVADYLKANSADAVKVEGHCDERGTEEYNRSLGDRRALALREDLVRLGIDPNRVDTISYGKDRPAEPGHDEAAWRKNRRGEFILLTPPK